MQEWPVAAEDQLLRTRPLDRLHQVVEPADAGGVGIDIRIAHQLVDETDVGAPVVGEAAQMRDDEPDLRVFGREQLNLRGVSHHVVENRQPVRAGALANFPADPRVVPVHLDALEAVDVHGCVNELRDPAGIPVGMDHREAGEPARSRVDDAGEQPVSHPVVGMEGREQDGPADARPVGTPQIVIQRGAGIPGSGQAVSQAGVAMCVDDHFCAPGMGAKHGGRGHRPDRADRPGIAQ